MSCDCACTLVHVHFCCKRRKEKANSETSNLLKQACQCPWLISVTQWFGTVSYLTLIRLITVLFCLIVIFHTRALKDIINSRFSRTDGVLLLAHFLFLLAGRRTLSNTRVTLQLLFEKEDKIMGKLMAEIYLVFSQLFLVCLSTAWKPSSTAFRHSDTKKRLEMWQQ